MLLTPYHTGYRIGFTSYELKTKPDCTGSENCNSKRRTIGVRLHHHWWLIFVLNWRKIRSFSLFRDSWILYYQQNTLPHLPCQSPAPDQPNSNFLGSSFQAAECGEGKIPWLVTGTGTNLCSQHQLDPPCSWQSFCLSPVSSVTDLPHSCCRLSTCLMIASS